MHNFEGKCETTDLDGAGESEAVGGSGHVPAQHLPPVDHILLSKVSAASVSTASKNGSDAGVDANGPAENGTSETANRSVKFAAGNVSVANTNGSVARENRTNTPINGSVMSNNGGRVQT